MLGFPCGQRLGQQCGITVLLYRPAVAHGMVLTALAAVSHDGRYKY